MKNERVKRAMLAVLAVVMMGVCVCSVFVVAYGSDKVEPIRVIGHEEYTCGDLDRNLLYIEKVVGVVDDAEGGGHIKDCECGYDFIVYHDLPVGTEVTSYFVLDNEHDFEVLTRFDFVGDKLVYIC